MNKLDAEKEDKRKIREYRRRNAKLYPIYKMFSWDLLFFYSVEFLFYIIAKKVTAPEILITNADLTIYIHAATEKDPDVRRAQRGKVIHVRIFPQ